MAKHGLPHRSGNLQEIALRGPEPKFRNLSGGNPERTLLGDDTRRAGELPAPALPPEIGRRGKGGEDAPDLHRHPVGIGCRLDILRWPRRGLSTASSPKACKRRGGRQRVESVKGRRS